MQQACTIPNVLEHGFVPHTLSGLYLPAWFIQQVPMHRRPIGIDLFSGAGGFSLGFINAGCEVIAAVDNDIDASITYLTNLGAYPIDIIAEDGLKQQFERKIWELARGAAKEHYPDRKKSSFTEEELLPFLPYAGKHNRPGRTPVKHFFLYDMRNLTGEMILERCQLLPGEIDVVFGGPPCQGFSKMNTSRSPVDLRNSLVFEFIRLVLELQPKTMVMENVPELLHMVTPEGVPVIDAISLLLEAGNFGIYDTIRQSLLSTAGSGAVIRRSGKPPKKKRRAATASHTPERQFTLFPQENSNDNHKD